MLYFKNVPGWERVLRVAAGVAMIACGLLGLPGLVIGYLVAASGIVTALTGFFGFLSDVRDGRATLGSE